ncbi:hypothetical protein ACP70R_015887 [Stipagrostis hirtigluma subsp. patula]
MAGRRPRDEDDEEETGGGADDHRHRHGPRRIRPALPVSSDERRAAAAETIHQIVSNLETVIRSVVREEMQNIFPLNGHIPQRSPPLRIQEEITPPLKLVFVKQLKLPLFTNSKLVDVANNAIKVQLVDTRTNHPITPPNALLGSSVKLEVLVLDGDFQSEDRESWSADQFNAAIVKAREGKRPLLVGTLNVPMSNHGVAVIDDVSFTDNSSWIRSRKFRIGVRVMLESYCGPRIQEAVSERFTVKDHRGELYQKHYPPSLTDNVWRLRNIRKDGPIDKRLETEGIKNVQDFLKLYTRDPNKLRTLLGMSDRQWIKTLNHAKTCDLRGKYYVFKAEGYQITFNPIGEVLAARIGDQTCPFHELGPQQMCQVHQLAIQAYQHWDELEEVATNGMPVAATETLIPFHQESPINSSGVPVCNSGWEWETNESQESMISSGSQNANYLNNTGTASSSGAAAMTTNSSSTSNSSVAVPANDAMLWGSSMAADNQFSWQQNTMSIGGWDQVD